MVKEEVFRSKIPSLTRSTPGPMGPERGHHVAARDTRWAELELELTQTHMAQQPVLRGEVGCACVAREVSVERGGMGERGCAM